MKNSTQNMSGFSFVELAMIITIIGLLAGAILVGQELIYQSKLRNVIAQILKHEAAWNSFDNKFRAVPGDFSNAEAMGLSGKNCPTQPGCNGDGNRQLQPDWADPENLNFWYHLYQAGMLKEPVDGLTLEYGVGLPQTDLRETVGASVHNYGSGGNGNSYSLGREINGINVFMTSYEAFMIDNKLDDGLGFTGRVTGASHPYSNPCVEYYIESMHGQYREQESDDQKCGLYMSIF